FFCSTVAASTGTAVGAGGAAFVPVQEVSSPREPAAKNTSVKRWRTLVAVNASRMSYSLELITTASVFGFCYAIRGCNLCLCQHALKPDFGQSTAYLLDVEVLKTSTPK